MPRPDPRICSASRANFPGSAALHFVFVELRCLFLYWWSFRNALVKLEVTLYLVDERVHGDDVGAMWLDTVGCIGDDVSRAANSFDTNFHGSCATYLGDNYLPWMVHSCSLIVLLILLWSIHRFIVEGNSFNQVFGSGYYLVFTWKLSHDRIYRTLATILPFFTGALLGAILAVTLGLIGSSSGALGLRRALSLLGSELVLQVLCLVALLRPTLPGFHWQTQEFRRLHFARTWLNLIWESNDMLAHTLSDAICIRTPDFIHVKDYALLWQLHVKYDEMPEDEAEDFRSLVAHENEAHKDSENQSLVPCGGWCLASVAVAAIASLIALLYVASGSALPSHHQDDLSPPPPEVHTEYPPPAAPLPCIPTDCPTLAPEPCVPTDCPTLAPVHCDCPTCPTLAPAHCDCPTLTPVPCVPTDCPTLAPEPCVPKDCPPPATAACPTDPGADYCLTGFHDWHTLWDDEKQSYCCSRCGRACPAPPSAPEEPGEFDCNAGIRNWYFGWSDAKKQWCCQQVSRGCPGTWDGPDHPEANGWAGPG